MTNLIGINLLSEMTPEQLLEANRPFLAKIYNRQELTDTERFMHEAIVREADRQLTALRQQELDERAARFASQEQVTIHPVCGHRYSIAAADTNADEIADLKTQMCPGCIEEMIAFEQACEEEYQASMDDEPLRNERGDRLE